MSSRREQPSEQRRRRQAALGCGGRRSPPAAAVAATRVPPAILGVGREQGWRSCKPVNHPAAAPGRPAAPSSFGTSDLRATHLPISGRGCQRTKRAKLRVGKRLGWLAGGCDAMPRSVQVRCGAAGAPVRALSEMQGRGGAVGRFLPFASSLSALSSLSNCHCNAPRAAPGRSTGSGAAQFGVPCAPPRRPSGLGSAAAACPRCRPRPRRPRRPRRRLTAAPHSRHPRHPHCPPPPSLPACMPRPMTSPSWEATDTWSAAGCSIMPPHKPLAASWCSGAAWPSPPVQPRRRAARGRRRCSAPTTQPRSTALQTRPAARPWCSQVCGSEAGAAPPAC